MPAPYIGITGFMSATDVSVARTIYQGLLDAPPASTSMYRHSLMVGVLASQKTIRGPANKHPLRYPGRDQIARIFLDEEEGVLNLVHYASDTPPTVSELEDLVRVGGDYCDGFQFNGAWPTPGALIRAGITSRTHRVVLQVRPTDSTSDLEELDSMIRAYDGIATDALVDGSGGRGQSLDIEAASVVTSGLKDTMAELGICMGVAGGLDGARLREIGGAFDLREVSIDAEGRLRDDAPGGGRLRMDKVEDYLTAAVQLIM